MDSERDQNITTPTGIKVFRELMKKDNNTQQNTEIVTEEERDLQLLNKIRIIKQKSAKKKNRT